MKTVHETANILYVAGKTDAYALMKFYIAERDRYIEHEQHGEYSDFVYIVCCVVDEIIVAMREQRESIYPLLDRLYYLAQGARTIHRPGADDVVDRAFDLYYALYEAYTGDLP